MLKNVLPAPCQSSPYAAAGTQHRQARPEQLIVPTMAGNGGEALEEQDFKVDLVHKVRGAGLGCLVAVGGCVEGAGDHWGRGKSSDRAAPRLLAAEVPVPHTRRARCGPQQAAARHPRAGAAARRHTTPPRRCRRLLLLLLRAPLAMQRGCVCIRMPSSATRTACLELLGSDRRSSCT